MKDYERQQLELAEQAAPFVGEEITAIGVCWPTGGLLRRRGLGALNALAVTPTRVVLIAGRRSPPLIALKRVVRDWPHAELAVTTHSFVDESFWASTGNTTRTRKTHATLASADGSLTVEFLNRAQISYGVLKPLKAACPR